MVNRDLRKSGTWREILLDAKKEEDMWNRMRRLIISRNIMECQD